MTRVTPPPQGIWVMFLSFASRLPLAHMVTVQTRKCVSSGCASSQRGPESCFGTALIPSGLSLCCAGFGLRMTCAVCRWVTVAKGGWHASLFIAKQREAERNATCRRLSGLGLQSLSPSVRLEPSPPYLSYALPGGLQVWEGNQGNKTKVRTANNSRRALGTLCSEGHMCLIFNAQPEL